MIVRFDPKLVSTRCCLQPGNNELSWKEFILLGVWIERMLRRHFQEIWRFFHVVFLAQDWNLVRWHLRANSDQDWNFRPQIWTVSSCFRLQNMPKPRKRKGGRNDGDKNKNNYWPKVLFFRSHLANQVVVLKLAKDSQGCGVERNVKALPDRCRSYSQHFLLDVFAIDQKIRVPSGKQTLILKINPC